MTKKEKIKETILFTIKSIIFIYIAKEYLFNAFLFLFLGLISGDIIHSEAQTWILYNIGKCTTAYLYIVSMYFVAKKLGLIKVIDKSPLWIVALILIIYELALTISLPINLRSESLGLYLIHNYKLIISSTFTNICVGIGFIGTFITYKTVKFLIKKYPKLSWLRKLYPSKLEEIISFKNIKNIIFSITKKEKS